MASSKDNMLVYKFSGKVGNVLLKVYGDKVVMSKIPNMENRVLSEKQIELNTQMKKANFYAKSIMADPVRKEESSIRLSVASNKLYRALVKEYILKKGEI